MTRRVRFAPQGRAQFLSALAYIRADRPGAARGFRVAAEDSLSRLSDIPDSGRLIPEFPALPFREVIVLPYRFLYRVRDDEVWVVAVWHEAQIPDEPEQAGG
jgi:toxin ParE1/3/4